MIKRVLIFDDQQKWLDLIKDTLKHVASTFTVIDPDNWNKQISGSYWDAIVVDVQILGFEETGVQIAEKSIHEFGVTSPVIIISGIANLAELERDYGDIFYGYVSKDNFSTILPDLVQKAVTDSEKYRHMRRMLTGIARRHAILEELCNDQVMLEYAGLCPSIGNERGRTFEEIINGIGTHPGQDPIHKIGKSVLGIITSRINAS